MRAFIVSLVACIFIASQLPAAPPKPPDSVEVKRDVNYAGDANPAHLLDLYLPKKPSDKPRPLIVFIHGGGWHESDKTSIVGLLFALIQDGAFTGASINYRLSDEAKWPAQIHDCKGALRWLRAHAKEYHFDPEKVGLIGISAGGHLVSLLGTSDGVAELEGTVGGNAEQGSRVQCVINLCGVADMLTVRAQGSIIDPEQPGTPFFKLFGGPLSEHAKEATAASPVNFITDDDPPFLHVHGTKDPLVPFAQSVEFSAALKKKGVSSTLITGKDGGHVFVAPEMLKMMRLFVEKHLLGKQADVHDIEVQVK
jgi:acetyl esterase/lipase